MLAFLRFLNHKSTIFLVFTVFHGWLAISLCHDVSLKHSDLIRHTGWVTHMDSIRVYSGRFSRGTLMLTMSLDSNPSVFFKAAPQRRRGNFDFIKSKVSLGDTVMIYTKPRLWKVFGLGRQNQIMTLKQDHDVLIQFKKDEDGASKVLFAVSMALACLAFYIWMTVRRQRERNSADVENRRL